MKNTTQWAHYLIERTVKAFGLMIPKVVWVRAIVQPFLLNLGVHAQSIMICVCGHVSLFVDYYSHATSYIQHSDHQVIYACVYISCMYNCMCSSPQAYTDCVVGLVLCGWHDRLVVMHSMWIHV